MLSRLIRPLAIAALAAAAVTLAGGNRAHAGIRITLSDGTPADTVYLFTTGNSYNTPNGTTLTIDGYTVVVNSVLDNFPGSNITGGTLTTTTQITTNDSTPPSNLTITADVITDAAATAMTQTDSLATFTRPGGTQLNLTNDVTGNGPLTGGTVTGTSTANGTTAGTGGTGILSIPGLQETATTVAFAGGPGYTLSNTTVLSGVGLGVTESVTIRSMVAAPEPATLAMAFSALPVLGVIAYRKNRRKTA